MFQKILIAEDFQGESQGIADALKNKLQIQEIQQELYCDKAYNRFKVAQQNNVPYDLLITDLHFKKNHVTRRITSGQALITTLRKLDPTLKVIVNSMIDNPAEINPLFKELHINAYVCKGRDGLLELTKAIHEVYHNRTYVSPQIDLNSTDTVFEMDAFDLMILKELAEGLTKKEISEKFKRENIKPNSESTIDKKVSKLFDAFGARNTQNLIAKLARKGKI
ncbi:helix-turn-helix transcriptional regulator [Maribacter sp. 2-571]|uniref:helix-turn-helix transcriptional regulator n=1 Tax=Maribacter sp. 2-571 TaxID=3417569 RepID=UPI003D32E648